MATPFFLATVFVAATAVADDAPSPGIVVTGTPTEPPRGALVETLRIQLAGRADIRTGPTLQGSTIAANTDAASALIGVERAKLVVWVEKQTDASGTDAYLLHLVGDREGRVLVFVLRVDSKDELGLDRALGLKVAEVFDAIVAEPKAAVAQQLDRSSERKPASPIAPKTAHPRFGFVGSIGGWGATGSGTAPTQGGVDLSAGARMSYGAFLGELAATGRAVTELQTQADDGRVDATEGDVGAAIRLAGIAGFLGLGAELGVGARILQAEGQTPGGRIGTGSAILPYVSLLPQATFFVASFLALRVDVGLELSLRHHRFLVNEVPVLDLGVPRGTASGCFVFFTP